MTGKRLDSLPAIERACWRELERATQDPQHGWRLVVLATVDGEAADARSVVLREVDADRRELVIFSDSRARKVAQLRTHPQATLVAWSRELSWQVRLRVALSAEEDGLAVSTRWARVKMSPAVNDYLAALPPGTPIAEHLPERDSREHFAVVTAKVESIDWLELHADGHRRARFDADGATWLAA